MTHNRHDPTQKQFANAILGFLRETIPNEWKTFPSQVSDKYQTTFASQQSKNMRNSGFSGNRGIAKKDENSLLGVILGSRLISTLAATLIAVLGVAAVYALDGNLASIYSISLIMVAVCLPMLSLSDVQNGVARAFKVFRFIHEAYPAVWRKFHHSSGVKRSPRVLRCRHMTVPQSGFDCPTAGMGRLPLRRSPRRLRPYSRVIPVPVPVSSGMISRWAVPA